MTRHLAAWLLLLLIAVPASWAQSDTGRRITTPPVRLSTDVVDFGDVRPNTTVVRSATIVNESDEPVQIKGVRVSCGCTIAEWPEAPIAPGQSAEIELTFDSGDLWGPVQRYALLQFEGFTRPLRIMTTAHVNTGIRASRMYDPPGQMLRGIMTLTSTDGTPFSIRSMSFAAPPSDAASSDNAPGVISTEDLAPTLTEPALEHRMEFDFSQVEPDRLRRVVAVETDHPSAPIVAMHIDNPFAGVDRRRRLWVFESNHDLLGTMVAGETEVRTVTIRGLRTEVPVHSLRIESDLVQAELVGHTFDDVEGLDIEYRLTVDEAARGLIHTLLTVRAGDFEDSVEVILRAVERENPDPDAAAPSSAEGPAG